MPSGTTKKKKERKKESITMICTSEVIEGKSNLYIFVLNNNTLLKDENVERKIILTSR